MSLFDHESISASLLHDQYTDMVIHPRRQLTLESNGTTGTKEANFSGAVTCPRVEKLLALLQPHLWEERRSKPSMP
jgi:hypothetical protein